MTGSIVSVFPFRNRVSSKEAFEGLELGEGKPSRPVLRGPDGRKAVWLLGSYATGTAPRSGVNVPRCQFWCQLDFKFRASQCRVVPGRNLRKALSALGFRVIVQKRARACEHRKID